MKGDKQTGKWADKWNTWRQKWKGTKGERERKKKKEFKQWVFKKGKFKCEKKEWEETGTLIFVFVTNGEINGLLALLQK